MDFSGVYGYGVVVLPDGVVGLVLARSVSEVDGVKFGEFFDTSGRISNALYYIGYVCSLKKDRLLEKSWKTLV